MGILSVSDLKTTLKNKKNMKFIHKSFIIASLAFFSACSDDPSPTIAPEPDPDPTPGGSENVVINTSNVYQTIESFSASDCWMPNYIGKYWVEEQKEGIAKLLFSQNVKDGKAEGIGLSGWRFNLGGGTANQGAASDITDPSRRAESFMSPTDGSLDWTKQSGQQYFLEKAKSYGCSQFVMFSNTPPVYLTRNGKGYSAMGEYSNLKEDAYDDFANYISASLKYFKNEKGIDFDFISPVNEPQYKWNDPAQEGSGWQNSEIKRLAVEIDKSLTKEGLDTKILLSEPASWEYLYGGSNYNQNVVYNFFDQESPNYVGNLTHMAPIIGGHSYWTDGSWSKLTTTREKVFATASRAGLKVYQTEWSMLGDGYSSDEYASHDKATYMDIALYMSKVIHTDLTYANVSSWSYWTAVDLERWSHKNRFLLIKATPSGGDYGDITQSGSHESTKTLWVLGNYSLFIRPNYKRVGIEIENSSKSMFGSAYVSPDGKTLVAVYTNLTTKNYDVRAKVENVESIKTYTTSSTQDLAERSVADNSTAILVQPQSVVTVVYKLK